MRLMTFLSDRVEFRDFQLDRYPFSPLPGKGRNFLRIVYFPILHISPHPPKNSTTASTSSLSPFLRGR